MPIDLKWFRLKNGEETPINTAGNLYNLSILEEDHLLLVRGTPIEEEYYGECRIYYGPIKISPKVRNRSI